MDDNTYIKVQRAKRQKAEKLDLSNSNLALLPSDIFLLTDLKELDLSNNRINILDEKISALQKLTYLNLGNNQLNELPKSLSDLPMLKFLNITNNPLEDCYLPLVNCSSANLQKLLREQCRGNTNKVKNTKGGKTGATLDDDWWDNNIDTKKDTGDIFDDFDFANDENNRKKVVSQRKKSPKYKTGMDFNKPVGMGSSDNDQIAQLQKELEFQKEKYEQLYQEMSNKKGGRNSVIKTGINQTTLAEINVNELTLGPKINQGGFSIIVRGKWRGTNCVVKKIFDPVITDDLMDEFTNEVAMQAKVRHPNIVLMMAYCLTPPNLFQVFEPVSKGSLYEIMHKNKEKLEIRTKKSILLQTAETLDFLHKCKIVHRDIKSHNVLLDNNYNVKLCDFGIARNFCDLNKGSMQFVGTPTYMSPEQFQQKAYLSNFLNSVQLINFKILISEKSYLFEPRSSR